MELEIDRYIQGLKDGNKVMRRRSLGKVYERFKELEVRMCIFLCSLFILILSVLSLMMDLDVSKMPITIRK